MAEIEERIVREYLENHGFLVRQLENQTGGRKKVSEEGADFLVLNPSSKRREREADFMVFASELPYLEEALVMVRVGRAWRFPPAMLKKGERVFSFLEKSLGKDRAIAPLASTDEIGDGVRRLFVLPTLPTVDPYRERTKELLMSAGIDGILSFRSMLLEVVGRVGSDPKGERSEVLEMIRVLKNYDLIKDTQMELFGSSR